jgi:GntR family transcriptional repressor for pyruvate dehydrogenase complex
MRRRRLGEHVAAELARAILSGETGKNGRLPPERTLARLLGVTRTSLREGIRQLEAAGIVRVRHGDGIYVRDIHRDARLGALGAILEAAIGGREDLLRNLQEFRVLIQVAIARFAAERRTGDEAFEIETLARRLGEADDPAERARLDWELARAYAAATHNVVFAMLLNTVREVHQRWAPLYFSIPEVAAKTARFHRLLARAIRQQRPELAARVMALLLAYSNPVLLGQIRRSAEGILP